jgi:tRNA (cytidine/uridine-2'-O-)-methyltransferase
VRVVLYQPEIPSNTGNIGRLCLGAGVELHIVKPARFLLTDKALQRAGLDYWAQLDVKLHGSLDELLAAYPDSTAYYCSTKATRLYTEPEYHPGDLLIFGPESRGLPEELLRANPERVIGIPMTGSIRSLNLANSVSIILYEALRKQGFPGMGLAVR